MKSEIVLVTGGAGFIGSHLVQRLLESGHKVICVDNFNDFYALDIKVSNVIESVGLKNQIFEDGNKQSIVAKLKSYVDNKRYALECVDIRDKETLKGVFKDYKPSVVVNLAAMAGVRPSIDNPELYQDVNVRGFQNILEICNELGIKKIVQASSSSVYGNNKKIPFSELDNVDFPISPYAASKKQCEIMSYPYYHLYGMDIIHLRFFTVYGPRQRPDLAIHKFTKLISKGSPIPFFGDGSTKRDYTYIYDIIDGVCKSLDYVVANDSIFEVFNLGESETISLAEMVAAIEKRLGKKAILNKMPNQPGDVPLTNADIAKAVSVLGYNPITKFDKGIAEFVAWYHESRGR